MDMLRAKRREAAKNAVQGWVGKIDECLVSLNILSQKQCFPG